MSALCAALFLAGSAAAQMPAPSEPPGARDSAPAAAPHEPAVSASSAPARPITLDEAYQLSLKRSEAIASDVFALRQALSRVEELKGYILPHLAFLGSNIFQENPHTGIGLLDKTNYPLSQLTLTQPLFSGFREFLAFQQGKTLAEASRLTERRAESLLFEDVAQAFFNLERVQDEIAIRQRVVGATEERIVQLEHWVRIGRSRESEVLAARSQLAQTEAQTELARGQEAVAQELLRFLTGVDATFLPQAPAVAALQPLDPFLERAQQRDDVQAQRRNLEASRLFATIQSRQRFGALGLTANYYLKRFGFSQHTRYDGNLALNLPLFDGGVITQQVRQAEAAEGAAAQGLSLAQRQAEEQVRSAYRSCTWSLSALDALKKAAELASQNLQAQERDYRLSLVTNLEVLDSLNGLQSTELQLNQARAQSLLSRAQLEAAAGGTSLHGPPESKP